MHFQLIPSSALVQQRAPASFTPLVTPLPPSSQACIHKRGARMQPDHASLRDDKLNGCYNRVYLPEIISQSIFCERPVLLSLSSLFPLAMHRCIEI